MTPSQAKIAEWRRNPVQFVRDQFQIEPDAWQVEVLMAVATGSRVALKASKGPGKTAVLSMIGWWFVVCFPHAKCVATSITGDNLRDGLWTEFSKWQKRSPFLRAAFTWTKERIFAKEHPETWFISARAWSKDADATKQGEAMAGIHADFVLFLIDEAGGVPDAVAATAEAGLANADKAAGRVAKLVIAGNPTELAGPLYRACTTERALWWVKEISGDPDDPNRAPRVSIDWAREQIQKYGADNPWVLVNVFGKFPPSQSNKLMGDAQIGAAAARLVADDAWKHAPKVLGVDVARFGDDQTVLFPRQGLVAFRPTERRNKSTMEVADLVAFTIADWRPDAVFIDATGVGAGVVDRLHQLGHDVVGVESGGGAIGYEPGQPPLKNRRAEMWWQMAQWLKGGCIPDIPELRRDLGGPTFWFDAAGRICLESKDDLKERGLPSPDHADALALTFAAPVAPVSDVVAARNYRPGASWTSPNDYDPFDPRRL